MIDPINTVSTPEGNFVLFSCDADTQTVAEAELREIFPHIPPFLWLTDKNGVPGGVALASLPVSFEACVSRLERTQPIFLRHVAPVQRTVALTGEESDLNGLEHAVAELAPLIDPTHTTSVQSRWLGENWPRAYNRTTLNRVLFARIAADTGTVLDARAPGQVISVCCTADTAFLGVSGTQQNRSPWPGGERRFKKEDEQISRTEFKLLEALEVFGLELPTGGTALDLGAAPGSWTRVLRQRGLRVVAVDATPLDSRLAGDAGIEPVLLAPQYYRTTEAFDVIVDDMKWDARDSVALLLNHRSALKPGGLAIITLKLARSEESARTVLEFVHADIRRLAQGFRVLGARQLFHNRSEITVALTTLGVVSPRTVGA